MDSIDSSPPVSRRFPRGLRALAVDRDPDSLKLSIEKLEKCNYGVTPCNSLEKALELLRQTRSNFEFVICDVKAIDQIELLEGILETNIPVIITLTNEESKEMIFQEIHHDACAYILKPVKMKALRNISHYVLSKGMNKGRGEEKGQFHGGDIYFGRKIKESSDGKQEREGCSDVSSRKKARVVWTPDLHLKFLKAMEQIGPKYKAGPKKILDLMGEPGLTREHVASHLQKYRLNLSKMKQEKDCDGVGSYSTKGSRLDQNVYLQGSIDHFNPPALASQSIMMSRDFGGNAAVVPVGSSMMMPQQLCGDDQVGSIQQFEPLQYPHIHNGDPLVPFPVADCESWRRNYLQPNSCYSMNNVFGFDENQYWMNIEERLPEYHHLIVGSECCEVPLIDDCCPVMDVLEQQW